MLINLVGQKFERLEVLSRDPQKRGPKDGAFWLCRCDCGTEKVIRGDCLKRGEIKSCGCLHSEMARELQRRNCYKHGKAGTKPYICWKQMQVRCYKVTDDAYPNYGERGIKIQWKSFEEFYADMGEPPTPSHSIERKDNEGDYCKENCIWADKKAQANNRRTTIRVTLHGRTQSLKQWSEELGLNYKAVWWRVSQGGWSIRQALGLAPRPNRPKRPSRSLASVE